MAKHAITAKANLKLKLFTAIGIYDYEEDLGMFKSDYLYPTDMQSLKTKAFINYGEWDSKDKLQIRLITSSHCNRRIGSTSISPSGIDQYCGKDSCTIASHHKAQIHIIPH